LSKLKVDCEKSIIIDDENKGVAKREESTETVDKIGELVGLRICCDDTPEDGVIILDELLN
jgi:hypothetical protein